MTRQVSQITGDQNEGCRRELICNTFPQTNPPAQIRTCAANASGSCVESDAQTFIRVWMDDTH